MGSASARSLAMSPSAGSMVSIDIATSDVVSATSAMNSAPERSVGIGLLGSSCTVARMLYLPKGLPPSVISRRSKSGRRLHSYWTQKPFLAGGAVSGAGVLLTHTHALTAKEHPR